VPHRTSVRWEYGSFFVVSKEVMKDPDLSSSAKLVWIALAMHADNDTGKAWPSIDALSRLASLARPTIITAIKRLETTRYLKIERTKGSVNVYWIGHFEETSSKETLGSSNQTLGSSKETLELNSENKTKELDIANGHHTTQTFTNSWQDGGGGKLSPHDYKRIKELVREYPTGELDTYILSYFKTSFWFNKDGYNFGSFFANLGQIMNSKTIVAARRIRFCPKCGSSSQESKSGGQVRCTACNTFYAATAQAV
jgi:hypothetical protein